MTAKISRGHDRFRRRPIARCARVLLALTAAAISMTAGCSEDRARQRAQEAAQRLRESLDEVDSRALSQNVSPETVARVQELLARLHEYQGEINGKLDPVTVNAIQAFERSAGLEDDGILDQQTLRALEQAARSRGKNNRS